MPRRGRAPPPPEDGGRKGEASAAKRARPPEVEASAEERRWDRCAATPTGWPTLLLVGCGCGSAWPAQLAAAVAARDGGVRVRRAAADAAAADVAADAAGAAWDAEAEGERWDAVAVVADAHARGSVAAAAALLARPALAEWLARGAVAVLAVRPAEAPAALAAPLEPLLEIERALAGPAPLVHVFAESRGWRAPARLLLQMVRMLHADEDAGLYG